jgi:hypothetical protein
LKTGRPNVHSSQRKCQGHQPSLAFLRECLAFSPEYSGKNSHFGEDYVRQMKTKITLELEDELVARVSDIARRENRSVRSYIRTFLDELTKSAREPNINQAHKTHSISKNSARSK